MPPTIFCSALMRFWYPQVELSFEDSLPVPGSTCSIYLDLPNKMPSPFPVGVAPGTTTFLPQRSTLHSLPAELATVTLTGAVGGMCGVTRSMPFEWPALVLYIGLPLGPSGRRLNSYILSKLDADVVGVLPRLGVGGRVDALSVLL